MAAGNLIYTRSELTLTRRRLRRAMTKTEVLLWQRVRGTQILGLRFRRQYSVGLYVLDFYCPAARLAIEIDGQTHQHEIAAARDKERQTFIEGHDIRFLRFSNDQVKRDLDGVIAAVVETIRSKAPSAPNPPPTPS